MKSYLSALKASVVNLPSATSLIVVRAANSLAKSEVIVKIRYRSRKSRANLPNCQIFLLRPGNDFILDP